MQHLKGMVALQNELQLPKFHTVLLSHFNIQAVNYNSLRNWWTVKNIFAKNSKRKWHGPLTVWWKMPVPAVPNNVKETITIKLHS